MLLRPATVALEADPAVTTLQQLHDREIAGGVEWLFDGAWHVWIGWSPIRDEANVSSEAEALAWLAEKAEELYGVEAGE